MQFGRGKAGKGNRFRRESGWSFATDEGDEPLCPCCGEQPEVWNYESPATFVMKPSGRNPMGKNGILRCDNCGSINHLWRCCDAASAKETPEIAGTEVRTEVRDEEPA